MDALGVLFERYSSMVFGVCMKYLSDPMESEDATMSVFEVLTVKLKTHEVGAFRGWLYVVTKNHCLQILRARRTTLTEDLDPSNVQSDEPLHLPESSETWKENGLRTCLDELSQAQKQSIEHFYFESRSYEEIAAQMAVDREQVRSYIQNGRRNLRKCMEQKSKQQEFKQ
jgi:RNA polymerase sigma-70 factor (ECF subfamily)